jgi:hypothetical protein
MSNYWKVVGHPSRLGHRSADRGPGWSKTAATIRTRDNHQCVGCGELPCKKALPVDHLVPYRIAKVIAAKTPGLDPNDKRNLATLCEICHTWKTSAERSLHAGDALEFFWEASRVVGSHERIRVAMELFGLWEQIERRIQTKEADSEKGSRRQGSLPKKF